MNLAELRRQSKKDFVKDVLNKTQKKKSAPKTAIKSGSSLYEKVKAVCDLVQQRLGHLKDKYVSITTKEELHYYIDKCIETGYISLDTETTGLDPITDEIVGACIYTPGEKAAYVPINHISLITQKRLANQLTNNEVKEEFQRLVENNVKIIYFNAKFDIRVCRHQLGIDLPPYWDGYIAAKVLKEDELEGNLKYLWKKYCSPDKDAEHFTFDKMFEGFKFNIIPINTAYLYAAHDALMTWELFKFQEPYLDKDNSRCQECGFTRLAYIFREIEMPIISIISDIEDNGVALDVDYCKELSIKYHKLLDDAMNKFYETLEPYKDKINQWILTHPNTKIQTPINIGSSAQLAELFYDILALPPVSKKQPRGTGEEILQRLGHPLCKSILDFRGINKLLTTYIDKMPNVVNSKTKRIHCGYKQYGANTGRFASADPNLQNIPSHNKDIRPMFVATKEVVEKGNENNIELLDLDIVNVNNVEKYVFDLKIGDKLKSEEGIFVEITNIDKKEDYKYLITYRRENQNVII